MSNKWHSKQNEYNKTLGHLTIDGWEYNQVTSLKAVQLAAAAPDLLEACKELLKYYIEIPIKPEYFMDCKQFTTNVLKRNELLDKAESAISKAEGK